MISDLISLLGHWITNLIAQAGYPAIFVLMLLGCMLIPIPSEVVMPFAGFLASQGVFDFWTLVIVGSLASLVGSLGAYGLGYWGQERFVKKLIKKYGKYLLITYDEVELAERWFRERGELISFVSRLIPVVRAYISLPAGFAQMNVIKFSVYSFAGAFLWTLTLTYLGFRLGENWNILEVYFKKFDVLIIGAFVLLGLVYIRHKVKKIKKQKKA